MYKSSPMTFVFKYLFVPMWAGGFSAGIIAQWNKTDDFSYNWSRGALIMVSFGLIWLTIMMIRLQNVEATAEYITIKTFKGRKIVDYKDIEWISQLAMINPPMISMKYFDVDTGKTKKILILLPREARIFNFLSESEMTTFIRKKITQAKPDYSKESEPSRWIPVLSIGAAALPIVFIMNYYFFSHIH